MWRPFIEFPFFFSIFLIIIWPCLKRTGKKQIQEFDVVLEGVGGGGGGRKTGKF